MSQGLQIAADILRHADAIVAANTGKALTPDEIKTVKAAAFLRKIAPYLELK